eukprot:m.70039 g.70039  ORF g.70039 m.70039 type:complete len:601 (+) comp20040_c0_seq1:546-2348(+)
MHEQNIVHAGLTAGSILCNSSGPFTAKISCFDFSHFADTPEADRLLNTTPARWHAPEVLLGEPTTFASDVFSLGLLLSTLTNRCLPYACVADPFQVYATRLHQLLPYPVRSSPEVQELFRRLCVSRHDNRPSVKEVCQLLLQNPNIFDDCHPPEPFSLRGRDNLSEALENESVAVIDVIPCRSTTEVYVLASTEQEAVRLRSRIAENQLDLRFGDKLYKAEPSENPIQVGNWCQFVLRELPWDEEIAFQVEQATPEALRDLIEIEFPKHSRTLNHPLPIIQHSDLTVGKYLTQGGHGVILRGKFQNRDVIVKQSREQQNGDDHMVREALNHERVRACESEKESFVVRLLGITLNPVQLVFPLAEHKSLDHYLLVDNDTASETRSRFTHKVCDRSRCVRWLHQIASGLHFLAIHKVSHGDLSTGNILVFNGSDGQLDCKITDLDTLSLPSDSHREYSFTYRYAAPERFVTGESTEKSDVFSFAVIALEVLIRRPAFDVNPFTIAYGRGKSFQFLPVFPPFVSTTMIQLLTLCGSGQADARPTFEHFLCHCPRNVEENFNPEFLLNHAGLVAALEQQYSQSLCDLAKMQLVYEQIQGDDKKT